MGSPLIGLLVLATYVLAGMGVRERSIAAAVLIFVCYLMDRVISLVFGVSGGNPLVGIVSMMLLFANVRATILSRRWSSMKAAEEVGELPERSAVTMTDKIANVLPGKVWPVGRFVFYPLAGILIALNLLAVVGLAAKRHRVVVEDDPAALSSPSQR